MQTPQEVVLDPGIMSGTVPLASLRTLYDTIFNSLTPPLHYEQLALFLIIAVDLPRSLTTCSINVHLVSEAIPGVIRIVEGSKTTSQEQWGQEPEMLTLRKEYS